MNEVERGIRRESQRIVDEFPVFSNYPRLRPIEDIENARHRVIIRLAAFNVFVLIGAGISSYILARRTLEPIEIAHEQQKRFTADVSHELRTPLTALKMESEVALLNPASSKNELRATLASNLEETAKLQTLIDTLLRLASYEATDLQQNFTSVALKRIIDSAIRDTANFSEQKNITIAAQNKITGITYGDASSLTQLLVILLDNAIKYSPEKSTVTIETSKRHNKLVVTIKDQGSGIDPDALNHVFDRFYSADNSRSKATNGFGLGLNIAKNIADVHAATITLTSKVGSGTTATIELNADPTAAKNRD
jgi:signal transduction histidine kinase